MSEQLQAMVVARSDAIAGRLDSIVGKIDTLEEKFDVEMAKIPVDMKRRGEELHNMLVRLGNVRSGDLPVVWRAKMWFVLVHIVLWKVVNAMESTRIVIRDGQGVLERIWRRTYKDPYSLGSLCRNKLSLSAAAEYRPTVLTGRAPIFLGCHISWC